MSLFDNYKTICIYGLSEAGKANLTIEALERAQYVVVDDNSEPAEEDATGDGTSGTACPAANPAETSETETSAARRYGKEVISLQELGELERKGLLILVPDKAASKEQVKKLKDLGFTEGVEFIRPYHVTKKFWECFAAGEHFVWTDEFESSSASSWIRRTKIMREMMPEKPASVLDIGAGNQFLKGMLDPGTRYYSMDGDAAKNPDYVYDFNCGERIDVAEVDYAFAAGAFEYINDLSGFLDMILPNVKKGIVLSYHPIDFYSDIMVPRSELWNNALTITELILLLRRFGFFLVKRYENAPQVIYLFERMPDGMFAQKNFLKELVSGAEKQ